MKKKNIKNIKTIVFLLCLFILGFTISQFYNNINLNNAPSQCYTTLQSSNYFNVAGNQFPLSVSELGDIFLKNEQDKKIFFSTVLDTGSMRPTIPDYSIVILIKPEKEDIKVGDIIDIKRENKKNLLHRVIEITKEGYYITKGDNNINLDKQVWTFEQINGKVVGIIW